MTTPHDLINDAKRQIIQNAKAAAGARFVGVKFRKADGTKRSLPFNPKDTAGIKGTGKSTPSKSCRVRDAVLGEWRSFNLDRVISITVNGTSYNFF